MSYVSSKSYSNHKGLDLKSSDLVRGREHATIAKNAQYTKDGDLEIRPGFMAYAASGGPKFGTFTYNRADPTTGEETPEVIGASQNLHRLRFTTFTVEYSGASPNATISLFYDPDNGAYYCLIEEDDVELLRMSLGLGYDVSPTISIATLAAAINALTGFSATVSGDSAVPAAFLQVVSEHDLVDSEMETLAAYWETVDSTVSNPLSGSETHKNDDDFENVSFVQLNNVVFIGNGYDETQKYDGQAIYRAGLPQPATSFTATLAAAGITGNGYLHRMQYIQVDAVGNVIEGDLRDSAAGAQDAANEKFNVTVPNIQAGTGFNTQCAIVAGAQGPVNEIVVDDGAGGAHTMKEGATAYFFDSVSGEYVEREVTAVGPGSITVAGDPVTVADNAVISANLRVAIYRNESSGTIYRLVAEIPNNSFSATQTYVDSTADASLGAELVEPVTDRLPPPKAKYLAKSNGHLLACGNPTARTTGYWSDVESPEYFPDANQQPIDTFQGEPLTSVQESNTVVAWFSKRSCTAMSGVIAENSLKFTTISGSEGMVAHHSAQEINGVIHYLGNKGPRIMIDGQRPRPMGQAAPDPDGRQSELSRMDPIMDSRGKTEEEQFQFARAVAIHLPNDEKYALYLPAESTQGSDRYPNSNSRVYVYDYSRDAWLEWTNVNFHGGVTLLNDETLWLERRYSTFAGALQFKLYRRHTIDHEWSREDNHEKIEWDYAMQWEAMGEPSVLKKFLEAKIFTTDEEFPVNDDDLHVIVEADYIPDQVVSEGDAAFPGGGYGDNSYGVTEYGDPAEPFARFKMGAGRAKAVRLRFQNNNHQANIVIPAWELKVDTPYQVDFKS